MLQSVFDEVCLQRGLQKETARASKLAADLIDLFQMGLRDRQQLLAMLSRPGDETVDEAPV
ncbi:hypothetical protein J2046_005635 [Rhizobium petrolearium]|uniref:Uncharacterized protein n=2 Tax=Neorhizobium TaxID=1525371 RepID=A0ABV0MB90_9HYPH|nr:hypothetical protein [Neorhizobium petrolearium]MBP1847351.1 hypothetical protein [Neorhizobium petrolearium]MCC2614383.1 hypothetical protein [Neorhizobium petrolearium]WGI72481.1 hypothetical protein QEO92_31815 [Neorhizobium petrolearium]